MEYLLLAILTIIIYAEVLPTISMAFELVRTWLTEKITLIQQYTVNAQEEIQDAQARLEHQHSHVIGFQVPPEIEGEEDYE